MIFDLDNRTARLGVGEFSDFTLGPRGAGETGGGLWRAQLGARWHREFQGLTAAAHADAQFESAIEGTVAHRGWRLTLSGRIDQLIRADGALILRELKTVARSLPEAETALRRDYPEYFIQLAAYAALLEAQGLRPEPELQFVEAGSGLAQTVRFGPGDGALFQARLGQVVEFLELRLRARERLRRLRFAPPFSELRSGQDGAAAALAEAASREHAAILFEAPTGFGKTGVLLEFALNGLRRGDYERVLYLTSKSTGQIQAVKTLDSMMRPASSSLGETGLAVWQVRPKAEHCINREFHCVRDACPHLEDAEARWAGSGLSRFYLFEGQARDLETLRAAGAAAGVCPYEITRAALAFNDVWIGDYNYVFSPSSRSLFYAQAGFDPARTLLIVDEAHNLPARAADAWSQSFTAAEAADARAAFGRSRPAASLALAWEEWVGFLERLEPADRLDAAAEDEARELLAQLAEMIPAAPLDFAALGPEITELLWRIPAFGDQRQGGDLPYLWWCPRPGELAVTCLDAAAAIGKTLGEFGGVVLATATPGPAGAFSDALGLRPDKQERAEPGIGMERLGALTKRETRRLSSRVTNGASLLKAEEEAAASALFHLRAAAPWRQGAYDVACDARVDTSYRQRARHHATTAATVEALARGSAGTAVFFSSYAYAEAIAGELRRTSPAFRASLQPRTSGLAVQAAWIEESLASADALFLVLGSSFAESIDLLGGRVTRAMVVGPALPEVNAVQNARLETLAPEGREAAFRRVYQIPGMQKVNQALGRLVRAPGQHARVLLHCRRFAESAYAGLLDPDLQASRRLLRDADLADWLGNAPPKRKLSPSAAVT